MKNNYDITLITCTKDRPRAFHVCQQLVARQTFKGKIQWIIVDDGMELVKCTYDPLLINCNIKLDYIRRKPKADDPKFTLHLNLKAALEAGIESDKVLFIEDDDWYHPDYVGTMYALLNQYEMVGESNAIYYHIPARKWGMMGNNCHASLCQTGMQISIISELERVLRRNDKFLDIPLWASEVKRHLFRNQPSPLCIGMKGLGNIGIGIGHDAGYFLYKRDAELIKLELLIGKDIDLYKEWLES